MTTKEAMEWLRTMKFSDNDGLHSDLMAAKREALDKGIHALETLEKLEKWMEAQKNAD